MVKNISTEIEFHPLSRDRWQDFEALFGARGACGGCWCMWWRLKRSQFVKQKGDGNRQAMRTLVLDGHVPGILAYMGGVAVGWCAVEPRQNLPALANSRILKPVDDQPVWSVICFFIHKNYRHLGLSRLLIKEAVQYVMRRGGRIVEAYPVEPKKDRMPAVFAWTGLSSAFLKEGFQEVARRSETRPIMRYFINV